VRMLSVRCLSVLYVTLVHCGQTVGWTKMKVGLSPGHTALDGDPAPPRPKRHRPPIFGQYLLWPKAFMDEDATWYGGTPRPRRLCVRSGPRSPSPKMRRSSPPQFSAHFYCGQTAGCVLNMPLCMEVGAAPQFSAHVYCGHTAA